MKTILRYPGSKWNLASRIVSMMPEHKSYLEPFFGSGAVLFTKPLSPMETINDLDDEIVNLFQVIRDRPDELARAMKYTPYARKEYDNCFLATPDDPIEKARVLLVKSLQSHGFRITEKCGWKNDVQGRERAYCVKHFNEIPDIIEEVTQRLKQVQIEHMDAVELIKRFDYENVLIYLDPPYVLSTRTRKQYRHEMTDADHIRLLETIVNSKAKVMISGYQHEMYDEYLKGWEHSVYDATAEQGLKRKEHIWCNYQLNNQLSFEDYF